MREGGNAHGTAESRLNIDVERGEEREEKRVVSLGPI
jgi:hypothetical protein